MKTDTSSIVDRLKDMVSVPAFKVFTRVVDDNPYGASRYQTWLPRSVFLIRNARAPRSVASAIKLKPGIDKERYRAEEAWWSILKRKGGRPNKSPKVMEFMDERLSAVGKIFEGCKEK